MRYRDLPNDGGEKSKLCFSRYYAAFRASSVLGGMASTPVGAVKNVWRISDTLIAPIRGTGSRLRSEVRISVVSTIMNNTSIPAGQPSETKRGPATSASHSKTTARYRKSRVYLPVSGRNTKSPFYCMQCRNGGKRATLGLRTANKEIAAKKAAQIFFDVLLLGMDAAIEKHRKRACRGTG